MKIRVKENVGELSEHLFGKIGTVWDFNELELTLPYTILDQSCDFSTFLFYLLGRVKILNDYIDKKIHPDYHAVFEEVEYDEIKSYIDKKIKIKGLSMELLGKYIGERYSES